MLLFLDLLNFVSSNLNVYIITTKSNYKNKDINNITILMNIIYEASILLTISDEMLSMQKYCCYDTDYKNTCIVCMEIVIFEYTQEIFYIIFLSLTVFLVLKFLAMGSACSRNNDTIFSR